MAAPTATHLTSRPHRKALCGLLGGSGHISLPMMDSALCESRALATARRTDATIAWTGRRRDDAGPRLTANSSRPGACSDTAARAPGPPRPAGQGVAGGAKKNVSHGAAVTQRGLPAGNPPRRNGQWPPATVSMPVSDRNTSSLSPAGTSASASVRITVSARAAAAPVPRSARSRPAHVDRRRPALLLPVERRGGAAPDEGSQPLR